MVRVVASDQGCSNETRHISPRRAPVDAAMCHVAQLVVSPCVIEQLINLSRIRQREFGLGHPGAR